MQFIKRQLPKCAIYQAATSQMCNLPSGNFPNVQFTKRHPPKSFLALALGTNCSLRRLGKWHIREVATCEIVTWEVALMKLRKIPNNATMPRVKLRTIERPVGFLKT